MSWGSGLMVGSLIGVRSLVVRHGWGSRTACGLTRLSNRLTRQAGKLVRALQAGAQAIGIVWNNRHGRLFSSLRVTAGLVFLAQLFAHAPLRTQAEDGTMVELYRFTNKLLVRPEQRCGSPINPLYGKGAITGCGHAGYATHPDGYC